ncbi:hypothetical protein LTR37_007547 [Vermiconidia calcicola]|uniref:Uncharacterized protein n=1 Tax=Vermiconidia calcicola TaxID=1690605 RepID=A0ACC3NEV6_9PEZI|nr:hypothetical protein LTR37_007547 [Vermiconidia calcicola]
MTSTSTLDTSDVPMTTSKYDDIIVGIKDGIGTIKFNRPKALNSFGGTLVLDTIAALRELNDHPDTIFTVITGEGRFFCAGADVTNSGKRRKDFKNDGEKKAWWLSELATGVEFVRSLIDHKKVLVLAMNGPGVGAGASWFQGTSDIFYAAQDAWMQVTFSQLGLIPEMGAAVNWAQSIGVHRANDWLMFGGKATADEMHKMGLVNRVFPTEGFHSKVQDYLTEMLKERSGKSMMEMKRLQNQSLRDQRILALFEAWQALAERFVDGEPAERMLAKMNELAAKREAKSAKL